MDGIKELASLAFAIPLAWAGSIEWRLRNKVSKDRFGDLREDFSGLKDDMNRVEGKMDKLLIKNGINPKE